MKAKSRSLVSLVVAASFLSGTVVSSWASGFRNPPDGAASLGRAGGNIALVEDPSAVSHNPANLVRVQKPEALVSLLAIHSEAEFTSPAGASETTEDPWKVLPDAYAVWPVSGKDLVLGLGLTTPYGQSTRWSKEGAFRYSAPYFAQLVVVNVNPTVAARLGDKVSIGLGADVFASQLTFNQMFPWASVTRDPRTPDGELRFDASGDGLGGNVAVAWQIVENQRLALTYRSPVQVDYSGDLNVVGPGPGVTRHSFDTEIEFPAVVALGHGWQATDRWGFGVDVEWIQFSSYDRLPLEVGSGARALVPVDAIPQDWDDSWTFGASAEYQWSDCLVLRTGYIFIQSPIPDETLSPTLPDADRQVITLGAGYTKKAHQLDLAVGWSLFEDREVASAVNPAYSGSYDLSSVLVSASYGYSF